MRTVNLVATEAMIQHYFPDARTSRACAKPGIMSADFPIAPENCRTELGRWLATVISTTRFDDDASHCYIVHPSTEQGLHLRDLGERLQRRQVIRNIEEAEHIFKEIEIWVEKQRRLAEVYGSHLYQYRTYLYQWPVFGSLAAGESSTTEAFFDRCGALIRATGGVILRAGLSNARLPASLARTMAPKSGGGESLLQRYAAQLET